jgi:DNA integrity scanning protein DisA with diadenylate cyclase activity
MPAGSILNTYSKSDISDTIKKCHGRIIWTAKELELHRDTLYVYFQEYPDLWDVVDEARKTFRRYKNSKKVELSEMYQDKLLTKEDVPYAIGLRASMYILDNLGQEEGYATKDSISEVEESAINNQYEAIKKQLEELQSASSDLNICATSNKEDHKS